MRTATSDRQLPVTFVKIEDLEIAFGETHLLAEGEQCQYQHNAMEAVVEPIYIREYTETMVEITDTRLEDRTTGEPFSINEEMQSIAPGTCSRSSFRSSEACGSASAGSCLTRADGRPRDGREAVPVDPGPISRSRHR
ncbi:cytochrome P450 [Natrinema sp. SYSU A 869]|uniref:cytochrome P450 n=1 Tax=Natrinema sp. SYSU A 869 TaxID=2871694 RepID=UPI001CA3C5F8|nr:cytochrome P450 [Natrinema sp. SYSU A 869]